MEWVTLLKALFIVLVIAGLMALSASTFIIACWCMDKAERGVKLWAKH